MFCGFAAVAPAQKIDMAMLAPDGSTWFKGGAIWSGPERTTLPFYLILLAGVQLIPYAPALTTLPVKLLAL